MPMSKNYNVLKSILARVATTGTARRALSRFSNGCTTVFVLHRAAGVYDAINGHKPRELERILIDLKKRRFNLVSLDQVVKAAQGQEDLPSESIAFTMDDGYLDQIEVIAPIFVKHEVPLTVFLTTGLVSNELWPWDAKISWLIQQARQTSQEIPLGRHRLNWPLGSHKERLHTRRELQAIAAALPGEKIDLFLRTLEAAVGVELPETPPTEFSPASWDQVRQLENAGVRFAPHTHSHRILSRLQEVEVRFELSRSLEIVMTETRLGLPVLAYPVGMEQHFGLREMRLAESMGFSAAFAVCEDYARWGDSKVASEQRYCLKRFGFPDSTSAAFWFATGLEALRRPSTNFARVHSGRIMNTDDFLGQRQRPTRISRRGLLRRLIGRLHLALGRFDNLRCIDAERIERLVFVCRGNVCRSPYAEVVAKSLGLSATSCGVEVSRSAPAEAMAVRATLLRGKDLSEHMSRSIFDVPLDSSDCLVVFDLSHLPTARDVAAHVGCQITLLGLWREPSVTEIADPFGRPLQNFRQCFDEIDEALAGLMNWINQYQGGHTKGAEN